MAEEEVVEVEDEELAREETIDLESSSVGRFTNSEIMYRRNLSMICL